MDADFVFVHAMTSDNDPLIWSAYSLMILGASVSLMADRPPPPPFDVLAPPEDELDVMTRRLWVASPALLRPSVDSYLSTYEALDFESLPKLTYLFTDLDLLKSSGLAETLSAIRHTNPNLTVLVHRGGGGAWLLQERWFYSIAAYAASPKAYHEGAREVFAAAYALQAMNGSTPARALQWAAAAARLKLDVNDWRMLPNARAVTTFLKHTAPPLPVQQTEWGSDLAKSWLNSEK